MNRLEIIATCVPRLLAVGILALLAFGTCGCGTMSNLYGNSQLLPIAAYQIHMSPLSPNPKPFGGVLVDLKSTLESGPGYVLDIQCSLVGDVLTLPIVLKAMLSPVHYGT